MIQQLLYAGSICVIGCVIASVSAAPETDSPAKLYSAIKTVVHDMVQSEHMLEKGGRLAFNIDPSHPNERDLDLCLEFADVIAPTTSPTFFAATIALYVEAYQALFDNLKIPHAVSAKSFAAMEAMAVSTLKDARAKSDYRGLQGQLAQDLNAYSKNKAGIPHFVVIGECGAAPEAQITIKTIPPGGTVKYIPVYEYKVCEGNGIDANDPVKCTEWKDAVNATENLHGNYKYIATWPDGKKKTSTFPVTSKTITISQ